MSVKRVAPVRVPTVVTRADPTFLVNPLNVPVSYVDPTAINAPHEAVLTERITALMESMGRYGWRGAPLVSIREFWDESVSTITGSHRLAVWRDVHYDEPVPLVFLDDICTAVGLDFRVIRMNNDGDLVDAVREVMKVLSPRIVKDYGLDSLTGTGSSRIIIAIDGEDPLVHFPA